MSVSSSSSSSMEDEPSKDEITHDFSPFFRVYKDGRIQRFRDPQFAPAIDDSTTAVRSKDSIISSESGLSVRIYLPNIPNPAQKKFPLFLYIHGGGFCLGSASSPTFHNYIVSLVAHSNVIAVSVDYRLAPEHPLPIAYDDSWEALLWVGSHSSGNGPDNWINNHADFDRIYLGGESAGANIANNVAIRAGSDLDDPNKIKIRGLLLVHPFFGGKEVNKMYNFMCPTSSGLNDDPRLHPEIDPRLPGMVCDRILICVAEMDWLRERVYAYYEALKIIGWVGVVEIMETAGEGHGFHLLDQNSERAIDLMNRVASFLNHD